MVNGATTSHGTVDVGSALADAVGRAVRESFITGNADHFQPAHASDFGPATLAVIDPTHYAIRSSSLQLLIIICRSSRVRLRLLDASVTKGYHKWQFPKKRGSKRSVWF